jgi:putative Mg2+ transporter-C (MgtC) family protein
MQPFTESIASRFKWVLRAGKRRTSHGIGHQRTLAETLVGELNYKLQRMEENMLWPHFAIRLGLALLLGSLIGAERQWRQRTAGLRTHALVAAGAAMFVMLATLTAGTADGSFRIAGQVVSGIGFLGAGVILRHGASVTGLNTAATLWCSAAIGTLTGYGMYDSAITGTIAVIAAHVGLRPVGRVLSRRSRAPDMEITYLFRIGARTDQGTRVRARLFESLNGQPLLLKSLLSDDVDHTDKIDIRATLTSRGRQNSLLEDIVSHFSLEPGVSRVSWEIIAENELENRLSGTWSSCGWPVALLLAEILFAFEQQPAGLLQDRHPSLAVHAARFLRADLVESLVHLGHDMKAIEDMQVRPFLEDLVVSGLSPKTIQRHVDNLCARVGKIIDLNEDPSLSLKDAR